jgi:hypothetical protein
MASSSLRAAGSAGGGRLAPNPNPMSTTLRQAAESWIAGFDQVPASVIEKMAIADEAMTYYDSDSLRLAASPRTACIYCGGTYEGEQTLRQLQELDRSGQGTPCPCDGNSGDQWETGFPVHAFPCAWGTLFAPRERLDREWVLERAEQVAALGFFVFESEDYGCLLGIDGAGYDFFDAYWIPLYELRDLQWHDAE